VSRRVIMGLGSVLLGAWLLAPSGCATGSHRTVSTGYHGSRGYYGHNTWYDPYYTRRCCRGGTIVRPPQHQTWGRRPVVVNPPRYPHRATGRLPSIPTKRNHKKRKHRKPARHQ